MLRGCNEAVSLLPKTSPRWAPCDELADAIARLLSDLEEEESE